MPFAVWPSSILERSNKNVEINADQYRVAPGLGLRVAIPMLGPAPLAFDFAYPVTKADTDQTRLFSFYMSLIR